MNHSGLMSLMYQWLIQMKISVSLKNSWMGNAWTVTATMRGTTYQTDYQSVAKDVCQGWNQMKAMFKISFSDISYIDTHEKFHFQIKHIHILLSFSKYVSRYEALSQLIMST